jgi:transposase-like protein/transposase Tn5 family protein
MKRNSRDFVDELGSPDWADLEFEQATVGDARLDKRLADMAADFAEQPGAAIPQACETKAKIKGAYSLIENDFVRPEAMLKGHYRATFDRLAREPLILAPSDTTCFNFSHLPQAQGLGPIGTKGHPKQRGLWLHSTQAFTPNGLPLGLIAAQFWVRPQKVPTGRGDRHQRPFEQKESVRWRQSWQACQKLREQLPASTRLVNIDDMEADIYEVFAAALAQPAPRAELLIRSRHDRKLEDQQQQRLWDHLARRPVAGTLQVHVPRHQNQPARIATLQIRFSQVLLEAPTRKADQPPLKLWAVEAREVHPPKGGKPILWRLLSTTPVTTAEEAIQKVRWYALRWGIEVFHKIVKSVCQAEALQMQSLERLERRLTLDLLVAWRVQVLTQVGRQYPELAASDYFAESEWKALSSYINRAAPAATQAPSLGQMMQWIGRLGGFLKSKSNPHPGAITLARGLARLNDLASMWEIQQTTHEKCK